LVEKREETPSKRMTPQDAFVPIQKILDERTDYVDTEMERLRNECAAMPNTKDGFVQKQLGDLALMVYKMEKAFWTLQGSIVFSMFETTYDFMERMDTKASSEQARNVVIQTLEEALQKATKQTATTHPLKLSGYIA